MQQIETITLGWITQVKHRNVIAIAGLRDVAVVAIDIAFRIAYQKRHPAGQRKFDVRVQKICRLAATRSTNHERMYVALIDQRDRLFANCFLPNDDAAAVGQIFAITPHLGREWDAAVGLLNFCGRGKTSCSVLSIAHGSGFDAIQIHPIVQPLRAQHQQQKPATDQH